MNIKTLVLTASIILTLICISSIPYAMKTAPIFFNTIKSEYWIEKEQLVPLDGITGDNFGVAISFDNSTLVVGAPGDDDQGQWSGAVYIFTLEQGQWKQRQKITPSDGIPYQHFGASVCVHQNIIIVGAPGDNTHGEWSGAAYIFEKKEEGW